MLKIAVVGLGIIGGSIAGALNRTGKYRVVGVNRTKSVAEYALSHGYIGEIGDSVSDADVVFIALPPETTIGYLNKAQFQDGALVADICGVKTPIEAAVYEKPRNFRYVGCHPMAGKEVCGIENATPELFRNASMIITRAAQTDEAAVSLLKELTNDMNFGRIVECTAEYHDKKIALTSQLAHIVSNAYVKSPTIEGYLGFTGGSFQDMTRIAAVDEEVWTQLYLMNRDNLAEELQCLIEHLQDYLTALKAGNAEGLSKALKEGRLIKEAFIQSYAKSGRDL